MEILAFQLLVFALLLISSLFGRKVRNGLALIIAVFTIFAVFMSWLIILQFITIVISLVISESIIIDREHRKEQRKQEGTQSSSSGSKIFIAILVISALLYSFYLNTSKDNNSDVDDYIDETTSDKDSSSLSNDVEYVTTEPVFDNSIIDTTRENAISDYRESDYIEDIDYNDSKSIYGKWHYANSSREIESGSLLIEKFGVENFNFRLRVFNDYASGDISGTAKFITENIAVFQSDRCESLLFDFRTIGDVTISEVNCMDYHGRDISFNSTFEK